MFAISPDAGAVVCFSDPPFSGDGVVHPGLAAVAVVTARHLGEDSLHAGAVITARGAVALMAERGGGKSTTLGYLATECGVGVLTDDQLVVRDDLAQAGPRCIDLRPAGAEALGLEHAAHQVRGGNRLRVRLDDVPLTAPLTEIVVLEWGESVKVEPVRGADRLAVLARHRSLPAVLGGPLVPLWLASLPMRRLIRPQGVEHLPVAARALLDG